MSCILDFQAKAWEKHSGIWRLSVLHGICWCASITSCCIQYLGLGAKHKLLHFSVQIKQSTSACSVVWVYQTTSCHVCWKHLFGCCESQKQDIQAWYGTRSSTTDTVAGQAHTDLKCKTLTGWALPSMWGVCSSIFSSSNLCQTTIAAIS